MFPLKCEQALLLLDDLALGHPDPRREKDLRKHLEICASCRAALAEAEALFADLEAVSGSFEPLPESLGDGLADRLLAQLPALPGAKNPLRGAAGARQRAKQRLGIAAGAGAGLVAATWVALLWLTPAWLSQPFRLAALTVWRGFLAWAGDVAYGVTLTVRTLGLLLHGVDPQSVLLGALAFAGVALLLAVRSPNSRWQS